MHYMKSEALFSQNVKPYMYFLKKKKKKKKKGGGGGGTLSIAILKDTLMMALCS